LAVHHWTSSGSSSLTITTSCHDFTMAYWWLQIGGEKDMGPVLNRAYVLRCHPDFIVDRFIIEKLPA